MAISWNHSRTCKDLKKKDRIVVIPSDRVHEGAQVSLLIKLTHREKGEIG